MRYTSQVAQPSYSFRRQVEGLREPLLVAARDGFAGIDEMPALGEALRGACDRVVAQRGSADVAELIEWRRLLDGFDRLDGVSKAAQVARGLRLCHALVGRMPPAPAVRSGKAQLLSSSVESLPGIGPALAEKLGERGIETVEDLLWLVPRRYDDVRKVASLAEAIAAAPGERVTTAGVVESCRFARRGRVRWVDVRFADDGARLAVRFFNAHASMVKRFPVGARVVLSGALQSRGSGAEMANPDVLAVTTPDGVTRNTGGLIIPRYADIIGVPAATLRKACAAAVERYAAQLPDAVPASVAARLGLAPLAEAIRSLHQPPETLSIEEVEALNRGEGEWHRRLAFDELFVLGLAVARRRAEHRADRAVACEASVDSEIASALPFLLTDAQRRAIEVLAADLRRQVPMNRLLQGDVGSGKTAVAFAAALQAIRAGRQVAVMAPTEILAEQHYATLSAWAGALEIECALLTAATPRGVRASTLSLLAAGRLPLVVGTHSLLSDSVSFAGLGLAVIDEQHRFGVAQRFRLRAKGNGGGEGEGVPHLLVMTATPIPRTLALTAYGDLDVTVIDELPPGREPPTTTIVSGSRARERMYERVKARVAEPGSPARAFVVCPLVEPSEDEEVRVDWADATSVAAELGTRLAPARVGLVHGRMASAERDDVMGRFRSGALDVLVATTVIEVGVDVPEAILMVIEDADRFGLAQLHQLRGRIGRGGGESHCVLLTRGRSTADGARRLEVMAATCDGFRIAEEDLQLRGPGELLGVRQAGLPRLRFGDLRAHADLLLLARGEADALLAEDPELARAENATTREVLEARGGSDAAYGAEGG